MRSGSAGPTGEHRRVALLRGINVGSGSRIAMQDLRECTRDVGCSEVTTVLATGNVVLTDARPLTGLRAALEAAYGQRFGYRAVVHVLPLVSLERAVETYPFDTLEDHHDYVVFSDDPEATARVVRAMRAAIDSSAGAAGDAGAHAGSRAGTEAVAEGPGWLYWRVPKGSTLSSVAAKVLDRAENKRHLTTRNLRTLNRILAVG